MQVENKSVPNSNKSSVSHAREVLATHSSDNIPVTKDLNKKKGFPLPNNGVKRQKVVDTQPDYDVEYDLVKSGADEYTAMASESIDSIPKNKLRIPHDGLPGFPPPIGISNEFNSNVELSADAAGFILESADQTNGESVYDEIEYRDVISKPQSSTEVKSNSKDRQSANKVIKPSVKNSNNNNNNQKNVDKNNDNNNDNTNNNNNYKNQDYSMAKSEPKRIPVFADPPKEISESNFKVMVNKPPEPKPDLKIAIPFKMMARLPLNKEPFGMPAGGSDSIRASLPNLEPAIRLLGLSGDLHHSNDFGAFQAALGNIPLNMRRFMGPEGDKPEGIHSIKPISVQKVRSKRESERRFVLKQYKPSSSSVNVNFKETEPKTGESRYIPYNERPLFRPQERDDNESDDTEDDENVRPLFNFDELENRFPTALSSSRDHKRNDDKFTSDESRNKQKYGILGSGNFEIIRGGIYADDESATNAVPNYVNENENSNNYENNDSNDSNNDNNNDNPKSDKRESEQPTHNYDSGPSNTEQNSEEDNEPNRFSPFNLDFFTGTPILGFQGYDNFDASSVDKLKAPRPPSSSHVRSSSKVSGQRRHFFDPYSADSNLHVIATDEDLYSDS